MNKTEKSQSPFGLEDSPELMTSPKNITSKKIFIAGTRMNEGKTTTSLGLFGALSKKFKNIGYIKPIGQRYVDFDGLKVDEDSYLLNSIYKPNTPIGAMSPVAVSKNFTRQYLKNPEETHPVLVDTIVRAYDRTSYEKDLVIIEGTGHAGVGSIFDLSNAKVADILGAKVVIVSKGGIGLPVDEIAMNKALFDQHGVEILGAILNKVRPDKMEMVKENASIALERIGVKFLGAMPKMEILSSPNLSQIVEEISGRWINGKSFGEYERVSEVVIGDMSARIAIEYFKQGTVIITPGDRDDILLSAISNARIYETKVVSGIILTRNTLPHPKIMEMLHLTNIPVVIAREESYKVASSINTMTVKTQSQDCDKIPMIQKLISENINLDYICKNL